MKTKFISGCCLLVSFLSAQEQWVFDTVITTGANTSGIAITSDGSKVVVTNKSNPGSVKIINTSNYSVTPVNISAIENYPDGVTISSNNSTALVTTLHKVAFINLATGAVTGTFTAPCAGTTLYGIEVLPGGVSAVMPDMSSGCTQQGVRTIDATGQSSSYTFIQVNTSGVLTGIAVTPDGATAVVTAFSSGGKPVNVNLGASSAQTITGMSSSYGVATLNNTPEALIYDGDSICRVSLVTNSVTKKLAALSYNTTFQSIAVSADDKYAFGMGSFEKKVISLTTNSVLQTFTSGGTNVACNADGSVFYVTDYYNGTVRVYKKVTSSGINVVQGNNGFRVYPNPTTDVINFEINGSGFSDVKLEIYDMLGHSILELTPASNVTSVDLSAFGKGIYYYSVTGGVSYRGKLILD
jgi:hypothetical protein